MELLEVEALGTTGCASLPQGSELRPDRGERVSDQSIGRPSQILCAWPFRTSESNCLFVGRRAFIPLLLGYWAWPIWECKARLLATESIPCCQNNPFNMPSSFFIVCSYAANIPGVMMTKDNLPARLDCHFVPGSLRRHWKGLDRQRRECVSVSRCGS